MNVSEVTTKTMMIVNSKISLFANLRETSSITGSNRFMIHFLIMTGNLPHDLQA
jgi:hypothetical protein